MKSLTSKTLFVAAVAICLSLNLQAKPVNASLSDTTKKSKMKMDKMETKKMDKMDKKMDKKKMAKDTGKMSKMSKM